MNGFPSSIGEVASLHVLCQFQEKIHNTYNNLRHDIYIYIYHEDIEEDIYPNKGSSSSHDSTAHLPVPYWLPSMMIAFDSKRISPFPKLNTSSIASRTKGSKTFSVTSLVQTPRDFFKIKER